MSKLKCNLLQYLYKDSLLLRLGEPRRDKSLEGLVNKWPIRRMSPSLRKPNWQRLDYSLL